MSYKSIVSRDFPQRYYSFIDSDFLSGDIVYSNIDYVDVLPLVTESTTIDNKAIRVNADTVLKVKNKDRLFLNGMETNTFSLEFWVSFDQQYNVEQEIVYFELEGKKTAKVFVLEDFIGFSVLDSNEQWHTTYTQINSIDSALHVFALYDNRTISLYVNATNISTLSLPKTFYFFAQPVQKIAILSASANYSEQTISYSLESKPYLQVGDIISISGCAPASYNFDDVQVVSFSDNSVSINTYTDEEYFIGGMVSMKYLDQDGDPVALDQTVGCLCVGQAIDQSYIFGNLALYDHQILSSDIELHTQWGLNNSNPQTFSKMSNFSYFEIKDYPEMMYFRKDFINNNDYSLGRSSNIVFNDGLTLEEDQTSDGEWIFSVPSILYSDADALKISWASASPKAKVYVSFDGELTWQQVQYSDSIVPGFTPGELGDLLSVKVVISPSSIPSKQPLLKNLSIRIYRNSSIFADTGGFFISPNAGSTYNTRTITNMLIARPRNLGVLMDGSGGSIKIFDPENTQFKAIEFWFRYYDSMTGTKTIFSHNGNESIQIIDGVVTNNGFTSMFINGNSVSSYALQENSYYHIVVERQEPLVLSNTYIGGTETNPTAVSIGYLSIYPYFLSETDNRVFYQGQYVNPCKSRYLSYITTSSNSIPSNDNLVGTITEYSTSDGIIAYMRA